jgi:hypothetical protein
MQRRIIALQRKFFLASIVNCAIVELWKHGITQMLTLATFLNRDALEVALFILARVGA